VDSTSFGLVGESKTEKNGRQAGWDSDTEDHEEVDFTADRKGHKEAGAMHWRSEKRWLRKRASPETGLSMDVFWKEK
jgi:hypothetical protein